MNKLPDLAYKIDPARWAKDVLGIDPAPWQRSFLLASRGASILALTARQVGKTTTAAWAIAHQMTFFPGSLSIIVCPAHRQSAEAVRRMHIVLETTSAEFERDNVYGLELKNGSRGLALPDEEDSIRGLTVDGWIIADEAAKLAEDLSAAMRPMRADDRRRVLRCCRRPGVELIRSGRRGNVRQDQEESARNCIKNSTAIRSISGVQHDPRAVIPDIRSVSPKFGSVGNKTVGQ